MPNRSERRAAARAARANQGQHAEQSAEELGQAFTNFLGQVREAEDDAEVQEDIESILEINPELLGQMLQEMERNHRNSGSYPGPLTATFNGRPLRAIEEVETPRLHLEDDENVHFDDLTKLLGFIHFLYNTVANAYFANGNMENFVEFAKARLVEAAATDDAEEIVVWSLVSAFAKSAKAEMADNPPNFGTFIELINQLCELVPQFMKYSWIWAGLSEEKAEQQLIPYYPVSKERFIIDLLRIAGGRWVSPSEIVFRQELRIKEKHARWVAMIFPAIVNAYDRDDVDELTDLMILTFNRFNEVLNDPERTTGVENPSTNEENKVAVVFAWLYELAGDLKWIVMKGIHKPDINFHFVYSALCTVFPAIGASSYEQADVHPKARMKEYRLKGEPYYSFPEKVGQVTESELMAANFLLKQLYDFDDALQADDMGDMDEIMEIIQDRVTDFKQGSSEHRAVKYVQNQLDIIMKARLSDSVTSVTPEEIHDQLYASFRPFAYAAIMREGVSYEQSKVFYIMSMKPSWGPPSITEFDD